jgi:3-oxoacyl-[acyl-carrier protein] reductase
MRERKWGRVIQLATIGALRPNKRMPSMMMISMAGRQLVEPYPSYTRSRCRQQLRAGEAISDTQTFLWREIQLSIRAMELGIRGKRALVTGSSRGTGALIVEHLAREGATVFVHGLDAGEAQHAIAEKLRAAGYDTQAVSGDIRTDDGADQVLQGLQPYAAGIDILVNNYGAPASGDWHTATPAQWVDVYQQNVLSAVRMIDRFVPGMRERKWGRVIQLATIGALRPNKRMPHYYAAKGAMANLTASLAKDLAGTQITVNTISPGLIHTPEVEASFRALAQRRGWGEDWSEIEARGVELLMPNPTGRLARREEVADLVAFVASERASYLNGVHLRIDGGATDLAF